MIGEGDWACFLDHDAMFTTPDWYVQLEDIVEGLSVLHPDAGLLTAVTNRIGNAEQLLFEKTSREAQIHDIYFHRQVGKKIQSAFMTRLKEANCSISGVVLLISKAVWKRAGGFKEGFLGIDNDMDKKVRETGSKVYIMLGVYVYHYYRALPAPGELQGCGYPVSSNLPPI